MLIDSPYRVDPSGNLSRFSGVGWSAHAGLAPHAGLVCQNGHMQTSRQTNVRQIKKSVCYNGKSCGTAKVASPQSRSSEAGVAVPRKCVTATPASELLLCGSAAFAVSSALQLSASER